MKRQLLRKNKGTHWTNRSVEDFQFRIAFDFIAQLENRMKIVPLNRTDLAKRLGVTPGAVSQKFNNPHNLELKTIIGYARALSLKVALVAYSDNDPDNDRGPINSEIFNVCWEKAGNPKSFFDLRQDGEPETETGASYSSVATKAYSYQKIGNVLQTSADMWNTKGTSADIELQDAA